MCSVYSKPLSRFVCVIWLTSNSAMYNVLVILLHRPFVADGHLYSTLRSISVNSFITCASAADHIVALLRAYDKAFAVSRAPYLISYACYVAATIHARIAAKRRADSEAHASLAACLAIFRHNQETNGAVKRAYTIIQSVMKRLGVPEPSAEALSAWNGPSALTARGTVRSIMNEASNGMNIVNQPDNRSRHPSQAATEEGTGEEYQDGVSPSLGWSDIDGIIQSFVRGPDMMQPGMDFGQHLANHPADGFHHNMQPMMRYSNPGMDPMGPPEYRQVAEDGMGWGTGVVDGSASIDDLLFGLNGAALDSYPF